MESRLLIVFVLALASLVSGESPRNELCNRVAAGSHYDENDGDDCTVKCHIPQLSEFKAHLDAGISCDNGHGRCVLGECRARSYWTPGGIGSYTILIKQASLSFSFSPRVVVTLVKGSSASFSTGTNLCGTPAAGHSRSPQWNFLCRQVELERGAVLKFSVYETRWNGLAKIGDVSARLSDLTRDDDTELRLANTYQTLTVRAYQRSFSLPESSK